MFVLVFYWIRKVGDFSLFLRVFNKLFVCRAETKERIAYKVFDRGGLCFLPFPLTNNIVAGLVTHTNKKMINVYYMIIFAQIVLFVFFLIILIASSVHYSRFLAV